MTKPSRPTATTIKATTTIQAAFDFPGASGVGDVCARRASSSASAAAVDRTPETLEPKPLTPLSTRESVTIFFAFERKAKYDSSMSSKSIGPSHSSQRHDGALNGVVPA